MRVLNWDGSVVTTPAVLARPRTVAEVVDIVRNRAAYPSPVRAVGSRHSVAACVGANGGTLVDMTAMNRILEVGRDRVRVEAGALYVDIADALERHGLQFHVNTEIGNLTAGSAACCGTKDAAFSIGAHQEFGQVCSYVTAVKMVTPAGDVIEVREDDGGELMRIIRSSYGLLGIVVEVTFRVKRLEALAVAHRTYDLEGFLNALPVLRQQHQSLMMYILPFPRTVLVELRSYRSDRAPVRRWPWKVRNFAWATFSPLGAYLATRYIRSAPLRYALLQNSARTVQRVVPRLLNVPDTVPSAQIIRYPSRADWRKYVFSFWAFPEARYPDILREYCDFYVDYYYRHGYRSNLFTVGYRINQDRSSLLSYSYDGPVVTIDPVSTGDPGWEGFLRAYNEFASTRGGIPMLNQTPSLTAEQVARAFGSRLDTFKQERTRRDADGRLFSDYFQELLGVKAPSSVPGCPTESVSLHNFGGNIRVTAQRLTPRTEAEILEILSVYRDRRIRVLGASHSWSPVAAADDLVLDLRHFRGLAVQQTLDGATVTAGAAVTIREILAALARCGLTLPTIGAITQQSIAGAIATGTHGSGAPSLSHYARTIRIANYDPATRAPRIVDLSDADPDQAPLLRAARCSLGCLGIVLAVTLDAEPDYDVEETLTLVDTLDQVQATAGESPLQQFALIPYAWRYYVYRRRKLAGRRRGGGPRLGALAYRGYKLVLIDAGLHGLVKGLARYADGPLTRAFYRHILPRVALRNLTVVDASTAILTLRHDLYRHVEMEVFVPARHLERALGAVREITDVFAGVGPTPRWLPGALQAELDGLRGSYTHHYPIPCRRVLADDTLLSPTGGDRQEHYAIGVFNYAGPSPGYEAFASFLARCLTSLFDATLHWGKYFPAFDHGWVARAYPQLDVFDKLSRRYDPEGTFGNRFTDSMLSVRGPASRT
jgi:FAD/FMN-containing dehydrogenase